MKIDLLTINEKLKKVSDKEIFDTLDTWNIKEFKKSEESIYAFPLMLNGVAKRIMDIKYNDPDEKLYLMWGQLFLRAYIIFLCMRNNILESELMKIKETSPLYLFKTIFETDENQQTISTEYPIGLCRRIRNSIAHGSFNITDNKGEISFRDENIEVLVEGYEVIQLCDQIKRLYTASPLHTSIMNKAKNSMSKQ